MDKSKARFNEEFSKEAKRLGSTKAMAKAVGMPDREDEELLRQLVYQFEQKSGGLLSHTVREARREFDVGGHGSVHNKFGIVNEQSQMRYDFELPEAFVRIVEKHWPTVFTDRDHYRWFKKTLHGLMIRPNK